MSDSWFTLRLQYKDMLVKPKMMQVYKDMFVAPQVARLLTDIHDNPAGAQNMLRLVKRIIASEVGDLSPPRYFLCTKVLLDQLAASFAARAKSVYRPEEPEAFICLWDTYHGIDKALLLITGVIRELHGETDYRKCLQTAPNRQSHPPLFTVTDTFDEYAWAQSVLAAIDILAEDPSGFPLLDKSVAYIHEYFATRPNCHSIIVGAEIAQTIYKALYPLTEGI